MSNTSTQVRKLDVLDLEILAVLTQTPLWKQKLYETLGKRSVQTVGRRVERLQDDGLLESCILSPDEVNRDLIIGYRTTDSGHQVLDRHQICTDSDCDEVVLDGADHVHTWESAADYFSPDAEP